MLIERVSVGKSDALQLPGTNATNPRGLFSTKPSASRSSPSWLVRGGQRPPVARFFELEIRTDLECGVLGHGFCASIATREDTIVWPPSLANDGDSLDVQSRGSAPRRVSLDLRVLLAEIMRSDTQSKQPGDGLRIGVVWVLCIAMTAAFAGGGVGWWLGRASNLPSKLAIAKILTEAAPGAVEQGDALESDADSASWLPVALQLAMRVDSLEALLEEIKGRGSEPKEFVREAIGQLSENDLESLLRSAVRMDSDDLAQIEDVPEFAHRLSEIAMNGVVEPDEADDGQAPTVFFTRTPERNDPQAVGRHSFASDEHRIYAVFSRDGYNLDDVMVKWFRTDEPEILLFGRYPVTPNEKFSWVWLEKREGWEPGRYQVDVFSGDEALTPIGRGQFSVE